VTAIFLHSDEMAVGALRLLADRSIGVPQRFSVIACDDLPLSRFLVPSLTTIHVPFLETGARAAAVLLDLIAGRSAPRRELLPVHLVQRESTGPPPRSRGRPLARPSPVDRTPPFPTTSLRNIRSTPASMPAKEPST
jgi:LacI family transcriptional regulator